MRNYYGLGAAAILAHAMSDAQFYERLSLSEPLDTGRPKRRTTGKRYPFSSKRQNARYARQLAAGQLKFA